jgi:hypothetical protein
MGPLGLGGSKLPQQSSCMMECQLIDKEQILGGHQEAFSFFLTLQKSTLPL